MKTIIIDGIEYNLTPKVLFKKGDFVVIQETTYLISKIEGLNVTLSCNGRECLFDIDVLKNAHLWDITKDAKDGDVLVRQKTNVTYESIFIFNKIENNRIIQHLHYFTTDADEEVCEARSIDGFIGFVGTIVHPATKEQRELLFQKMKQAGYEWDDEKKELKKIEQKPAWSEEDEEIVEALNNYVKNLDIFFSDIKIGDKDILSKEFREKVQPWFKSLKERIQPQPKQEWSEEEIENCAREAEDNNCIILAKHIRQLKSLRPQTTWKQSDEHYELEEFAKIVRGNLTGISKAVQKLFEAKYLQLTGNKMYGGFKD